MELIETKVFTRQILELLRDDEYRLFQAWLAANPHAGNRIPGTAGLRKIRLGLPGRGKRGGARVIYFWMVDSSKILLLFAYSKNEKDDLSASQLAKLAALVREELKNETGTIQ